MSGEPDEERRELLAADWEPEQRAGGTAWRNPENGLLYAQDKAMVLLREGVDADVPYEPEGGA